MNAGIVYDAFGRTTTQASGATIGYYTNDLVRQQTTVTSRQTWTLDAAQRLAAWTTESTADGGATWTQTGAKTNHYGSGSDSPDWIKEDTAGVISRNVQGSSGDLDAITSATGDTVLQLTNIHGDVTVQLPWTPPSLSSPSPTTNTAIRKPASPPPATAGSAANNAPARPSPAPSSWVSASTTRPSDASSPSTQSPEATPTPTSTALPTRSTVTTSTDDSAGVSGSTG